MGSESSIELVHGVNNDYIEIDSGEVKHFLKRCGVRGLWGGTLEFPALSEMGGKSKVNMVTFEDVWEWLLEEVDDWKGRKEGLKTEDDEGKEDEDRTNGFKLELPLGNPMPGRCGRYGVENDAVESIIARARCAARRNILRLECMMTENEEWGGKGCRESSVGGKERDVRVVEFEVGEEVGLVRRTKMRGKGGRKDMKEGFKEGKGRRTEWMGTVEEVKKGGKGGKGRNLKRAVGEFAFYGREVEVEGGGGGGVVEEEAGGEEEEEEVAAFSGIPGRMVELQRAEVMMLLGSLGAGISGRKARPYRTIFERLMQTGEMGHVLTGRDPAVVMMEEFKDAWEEAWSVKKGGFWRFNVRVMRWKKYLDLKVGKRKNKSELYLSLRRSEARERIARRVRRGREKDEEARMLWGEEEEGEGREDEGGGACWVDVKKVLVRQVF